MQPELCLICRILWGISPNAFSDLARNNARSEIKGTFYYLQKQASLCQVLVSSCSCRCCTLCWAARKVSKGVWFLFIPVFPPQHCQVLQDQAECYRFPLPTLRAAVGCDCPKPAVCALHHVPARVNHTLHRNTKHRSTAAHTLPATPQSPASTAVSRMATPAQFAWMINTPPQHRHTQLLATGPTSHQRGSQRAVRATELSTAQQKWYTLHLQPFPRIVSHWSFLLFCREAATIKPQHLTLHMCVSAT